MIGYEASDALRTSFDGTSTSISIVALERGDRWPFQEQKTLTLCGAASRRSARA